MALHEQAIGATDEGYTPREVFEAMRVNFDVDVSAPSDDIGAVARPQTWIPARRFIEHDSLAVEWRGFAWMNPPFGGRNGLTPWLEKFVAHGNGVALVPDRTSAPWWQTYLPRMDLMLCVAGKIKFIGADGLPGTAPAQGTCLGAIGAHGQQALIRAAARGFGSLWRAA